QPGAALGGEDLGEREDGSGGQRVLDEPHASLGRRAPAREEGRHRVDGGDGIGCGEVLVHGSVRGGLQGRARRPEGVLGAALLVLARDAVVHRGGGGEGVAVGQGPRAGGRHGALLDGAGGG